MRKLSLYNRLFSTCLRVLFLFGIASLVLAPKAATASDLPVTKVLVAEGDVRQITNPGTVQAVNAILGSEDMPAEAKVQAVTSVLRGAASRGRLEPTTVLSGDDFLALDSKTGELVVIHYEGAEFSLATGSTGFTHLFIPIG